MELDINISVSAVTVFVQGLFSFFSPCILPIIPLYMGYLSGGTMVTSEEGVVTYNQKKVLIHTISFVIGISCAFYILGLGFSSLGQFLAAYQSTISQIGGCIIIILGSIQLGLLKKIRLSKEVRLPLQLNPSKMNPLTALLMGFTFSFAWTPCVGPTLSTVLIMISGTNNSSYGMVLMGIYTIGFILPFLFLGIFTTKVLGFFKSNIKVVNYTVRIGAVVMILIGLLMVTGQMNRFTGYMSNLDGSLSNQPTTEESTTQDVNTEEESQETKSQDETTQMDAPDFQLMDQYGIMHKLSEYQGKVVFLNFWATWCPPCVSEMPDIQKLYESYGYNQENVVVIGIAMPNDANTNTREGSVAEVSQFLETNGYTYPTVMDMTGEIAMTYGISSYPSTFMIASDGTVFGYIPGMIDFDTMQDVIEQTINK